MVGISNCNTFAKQNRNIMSNAKRIQKRISKIELKKINNSFKILIKINTKPLIKSLNEMMDQMNIISNSMKNLSKIKLTK